MSQEDDLCIFCSIFNVNTIFGFIYATILIIGVCGNLFVATMILIDRKMFGSSINLFILSLSFADMGNLLACCPDIAMFLNGAGWLLPDIFCPTLRFLEEYFLYASVLMQMSIGIERFMAICTPMRINRLSKKTSRIFILSVWIVAAIFAAPYLIYHRVFNRGNMVHCLWSFNLSSKIRLFFKFAECIVLYFLPLILLTILYSIMCVRLWGKTKNIADEMQQSAILSLRRSVVKMLIVSMLLYFIFYSPIQGIFIMEIFLQRKFHFGPAIRLTLNALSFSSSSANPIVYIVCCRHFRSRFLAMLRFLNPRCRCATTDDIVGNTFPRSNCLSFRNYKAVMNR